MSFLLDTGICSAHIKGDRAVFTKFVQHAGRLNVSAITSGELYSWVLRAKAPSDRLQLLQQFLLGVRLLPVEQDVAHHSLWPGLLTGSRLRPKVFRHAGKARGGVAEARLFHAVCLC